MRIKPFFPVFVVLVGVVIYAYYAPKERPEKGLTTTPKEYMEMVEKAEPSVWKMRNRERLTKPQSDCFLPAGRQSFSSWNEKRAQSGCAAPSLD